VARVAALIPDLLFGSKVQGMLQGAGHDVELVTGGLEGWSARDVVDVLVVDLVSDSFDGVALLRRLAADGELGGARSLAVYSHVDADTRTRALEAGFDLVVPRSRMMREGADLVTGLVQA
jgi:CheY-like chemotaxis protein